jgi:hypothetical protein
LALSETWLDSTVNDAEIKVEGYSTVRRDRDRHGGGVLLFVKDDVAFNPRPDLSEGGLESTWVELLLPKSKGILVGGCYRPPNDNSFLSKLENSISKIPPNSEFYILGDLNINYSFQGSALFKNYSRILSFFDCSQMISEATRITDSTRTILDHIITNTKDKISNSGTLDWGLSDHLAIFCTRITNVSHLSPSH